MSCRLQREEYPLAPHPGRGGILVERDRRQLVVDRPRDQRVEPAADGEIGTGTGLARLEAERMVAPGDDDVAGVEPEGEPAILAFALALQLDCGEGRDRKSVV